MLNVILALFVFGLFHSLTATLPIKAVFAKWMGTQTYLGLYRLFYNFVSVITLIPVFGLLWLERGETVWALNGLPRLFAYTLQGLGALGLGLSLLQIDGFRFLGLSQALHWWAGGKLPLPDEGLVTSGVYAITRHPLYLFSLMFLWFSPVMSEAMLGLCIGTTFYFCLGSLLEEQRLIKDFGADYLVYRQRVAWMIPFIQLRGGAS